MKSIILIIICLILISCNRSFKDENDVKTWLSGKEFSSENPDYNTFTLAGETIRHNEKLTITFDGDKVQYKDCTPTPYVVTKNEVDDNYEVSFPVDCIENSYFTIILRSNGKILTKSVVYDANYAYNRTEYADNRPNAIAKLDYLAHLTRDEVNGPQLEVTNENIRITRPIILADTQMAKMADTTKVIKHDTVQKLQVREMQPIGDDTTSLIVQTHTEKGDYYNMSDKLPLSYRYENTKFTFSKGEYEGMIRLDCYNETGLYSTVYCLQQGIFLYVNRGMEDVFTCAAGKVEWNHRSTNLQVQLYEVKTTNNAKSIPVVANSVTPTNSPTPQNNINVNTNEKSNSALSMIHLNDEMIKVDGGTFDMGSELNGQNASPVHTVQLHDFYMTKYLIPVSLWELIMRNSIVNDNSPVTHVSWYDVQTFITELNSLTKKHYRLPTEAEWEYAARGGNQSKGYVYSGTSNSQEIHQAGRSNELGLVDMTGVDWQWCSDWGNAGFYKNGQIDPQDLNPSNMKIKRGGGWANRPENCTVTFRHALEPNRSDADITFRLVLDSNQ